MKLLDRILAITATWYWESYLWMDVSEQRQPDAGREHEALEVDPGRDRAFWTVVRRPRGA